MYDKDRFDRKALGKVAIERGDIHKYNGKEHWIPIQAVNEDSEVEGKIHLSIRTEHVISSKTGQSIEKLAVRYVYAPVDLLLMVCVTMTNLLHLSLFLFSLFSLFSLSPCVTL